MLIKSLNLNTIWKDKTANFREVSRLLATEEADIFLLPEMFSTGFCMDAAEIADYQEESLHFLQELSARKNAAIAATAAVSEYGKFYNRQYFVRPNGTFSVYDKRHLFSYGGEDKIYTPGNRRQIVQWKNFRILLQTCYDLRFPVFSRNRQDYDAVLYLANWPQTRIDAWKSLLKARALENQAYVFGCNRTGEDGNSLIYPESSYCFFADGAEISTQKKFVTTAEFSLENLKNFREKFSFLEDRDGFELELD